MSKTMELKVRTLDRAPMHGTGGELVPIPQEAIDSLYARYQNVYGQSGDDRR